MNPAAADSEQWKAPAEDGQILIWPDPSGLINDTHQNQRLLSTAAAPIQGVPLHEARQAMRRWLGHQRDDQPLIATGHQVELAHPGVWAKNILINQISTQLQGAACLFAVDTDAPKHLHLRWPGQSVPLTDDPHLSSASWLALLAPPTPQHLKAIENRLLESSATWEFKPAATEVFTALRRALLEAPNLAHALANAIHELEWSLGARHQSMLTSPMLASPAYLMLAHHVLARADAFAKAYNQALAGYRKEQNIRNPGRPWPDLRSQPDEVEVPFWIDDLESGERFRAAVIKTPLAFALRSARSADEFLFDPSADGWDAATRFGKFLADHRLRLSPRALTLTAFLRLFVADQFVHGIGGARYDEVTDRLIAGWFRLEPPRFCVTTATLYFPHAESDRRIDLQALYQQGRRIRHGTGSPRKAAFLEQIAALPRHSLQRRQVFQKMHEELDASQKRAIEEWQRRFDSANEVAQQSREIFDRELFFAIQPRERLLDLMGEYQSRFA